MLCGYLGKSISAGGGPSPILRNVFCIFKELQEARVSAWLIAQDRRGGVEGRWGAGGANGEFPLWGDSV